jgi:hypothetical protein
MEAKILMSANEASKSMSISPRTLWSLTAPRGPIVAVRVGTRVLYNPSTLQAWIDTQTTKQETTK